MSKKGEDPQDAMHDRRPPNRIVSQSHGGPAAIEAREEPTGRDVVGGPDNDPVDDARFSGDQKDDGLGPVDEDEPGLPETTNTEDLAVREYDRSSGGH